MDQHLPRLHPARDSEDSHHTAAKNQTAKQQQTATTPAAATNAADKGGSLAHVPRPPQRRNRPALSCVQCRARKIRCDRNEPCASCIKSKASICTYEGARRPKPRQWEISPASSPAAGTGTGSSNNSTEELVSRSVLDLPSAHQIVAPPPTQWSSHAPSNGYSYAGSATFGPSGLTPDSVSASSPAVPRPEGSSSGPPLSPYGVASELATRVLQLEHQLSEAMKDRAPLPPTATEHGVLAKSRYLVSSHWMNSTRLFPLVMKMAERADKDKGLEEAFVFLSRCKNLGRSIKANRVPAYLSFEIGKSLPSESTSYRLVDAYFRTFESVYRVLHAPSFWREYRSYWDNPASASQAFIIQLQLCMAIGTCFQDDVTTLRQLAHAWIYEAQFWLVSPSEKSRLNLSGLQIRCLLHLAKETCGVGGDLVWISAGSLMRTAMYMGLHRDPQTLPPMSVYKAELRRRLWATILEIAVQSSLCSGGPPLLAPADFDAVQPSNYDDDQLSEDERSSPTPRPTGTFTQTSVQLALLKSFPTRLAIAQYVNSFRGNPSYEETLRLNSELSIACRALSATLQPAYDPAGVLPNRLSLFQLRLSEHLVHRFFLALNQPWLWSAQHDPAYYFSRKVCVETSLKLYRGFSTGSPAGVSGTASQTDDFTRLVTCGGGAFRSVPTQAVVTIALELMWQAQDDQSLIEHMTASTRGPNNGVAPWNELMDALKYTIGWFERRIRAGETNVKGYLFNVALLAQVEALHGGLDETEVERSMQQAVTQALRMCWAWLKEVAGETATPESMLCGEDMDSDELDTAGTDIDSFGLGGQGVNEWDWEQLVQQNQGFNFFNNFSSLDLSVDLLFNTT